MLKKSPRVATKYSEPLIPSFRRSKRAGNHKNRPPGIAPRLQSGAPQLAQSRLSFPAAPPSFDVFKSELFEDPVLGHKDLDAGSFLALTVPRS
jgi:hypothetical protein